MVDEDKKRSLQDSVASDNFDKREHAIERLGWAIMTLVALAALAGAFGKGALSEKKLENDSLKFEYQYFLRHSEPTELKFQIKATATTDQTVSLSLNADYAADVRIESITPRPEETLGEYGPIFHFRLSESGKPVVVTMHLVPEGFGFLHGKIRINQDSEQEFKQFVYP